MEDTLRGLRVLHVCFAGISLNPYSNGRYSESWYSLLNLKSSICLNPYSNGRYSESVMLSML